VKTSDNLEVDFLARVPGDQEQLVQVCADLSNDATLRREVCALDAASTEHSQAKRLLLVLDRDSLPQQELPGICVVPAYEWLLAAPGGQSI